MVPMMTLENATMPLEGLTQQLEADLPEGTEVRYYERFTTLHLLTPDKVGFITLKGFQSTNHLTLAVEFYRHSVRVRDFAVPASTPEERERAGLLLRDAIGWLSA